MPLVTNRCPAQRCAGAGRSLFTLPVVRARVIDFTSADRRAVYFGVGVTGATQRFVSVNMLNVKQNFKFFDSNLSIWKLPEIHVFPVTLCKSC